jgi:hypothetical protein
MKATLYVGCALRNAPRDFVEDVETIKRSLRDHFEVIDFVGLAPDVSDESVYETDIACAVKADIMLALCTYPSLGLGMEIQKRIELEKETIIAFPEGAHVSKMVTGAARTRSYMRIIEYRDRNDLINQLQPL